MAYRNGNYAAFYVDEPFYESNLTANATKDFLYYNMLRAWKGQDGTFPFIDSHNKNYNVRDSSDWEKVLKPRLHERLRNSKNIILFLSETTKNSRALREELNYGINDQGLPVIVIYPDYKKNDSLLSGRSLKKEVKNLWNKLPCFRESMEKVPTLHIKMEREIIERALNDKDFMVSSKIDPGVFFY